MKRKSRNRTARQAGKQEVIRRVKPHNSFQCPLLLSILLGLLVMATAACGGGEQAAAAPTASAPAASTDAVTPAMKELIAAAEAEEQLVSADSGLLGLEGWNALEDAINAKYGISIDLEGASGGPSMSQITAKLLEEHKAGRERASTDIMNASGANHLALAEGGVLLSIDWKKYMPDLRTGEVTDDGTGILIGVAPIVLVYNTDVIKPSDVPKKLEDLTDPKYKGLIAGTPWAGGFAQLAVPHGVDTVTNVLEGMVRSGNLAGLVGSDLDRIASGEFGMLAFLGNNVEPERYKARGAPLEWTDLGGEVNVAFAHYASVPKASGSPNLATLAALFLLTPEGQEIYYEYAEKDSHLRPNTNMSAILTPEIWVESPEGVRDNPQVYKEAYPRFQKLMQGG